MLSADKEAGLADFSASWQGFNSRSWYADILALFSLRE
jgi:hypothetical protein